MKQFCVAAMIVTALAVSIAAPVPPALIPLEQPFSVPILLPTLYSLEQPFAATIELNARGAERIYVHFAPNATRLEVRVRGQTQRLELTTLGDNMKGDVLVSDFNFDGYADIAVPIGIVYDRFNYSYDLYTFQPSKSRFVPLEFPGNAKLCKPLIRVATRTIEMYCKSGPRYGPSAYRFARGKPYLYCGVEIVILNAFDYDQFGIYAFNIFNSSGRHLRSGISDDLHCESAPLRYLPIPKATLYSAPRASAITANYIVRGDAIRILTVLVGEAGQWVKVAYQSRKLGRIVRWIFLEV